MKDGLRPFIERELEAQHGKYWISAVTSSWRNELTWDEKTDEPHLAEAVTRSAPGSRCA
jgi:hypothetical protein